MTAPVAAADTPDYRAELIKALDTISTLRAVLEERERETRQPVAVIGMGCRFPGGADDPEKMWRVLRAGVDTIGPFPPGRWDTSDYFDPDPDAPAKTYVLDGGFLDQPAAFDAQFFGISAAEAAGMDPQQRMALEVAWEALERAGIPHASLAGTRTGVYVGASTNDYVRLRQQFGTPDSVDAYQILGESSFIAGRIAHTLGLRGPAQVLDTACSSSLLAVHQACQALRSGEVDLALAGGVNVLLSPYGFVLVSKAAALSPEGRCKAFDASADGYGRGEGCGMVVLKLLSDALADGDQVLAVVQGSAAGHDGQASGISVPSGEAQQQVIGAALRDAGLDPARIGYLEAHGTGTPLGDPIELRAADAVLGAARAEGDALPVGSVKTNFGHLEAAAGVAALCKAILALRHGEIPPSLHFETPNPNVDWDALRLRVPTEPTPWPVGEGPRAAGVSSFGASGTNVHLIVTEPPAAARPDPAADPDGDPDAGQRAEPAAALLPVSARSEAALRALAERWADHLDAHPGLSLAAVAAEAGGRRGHHRVRAAVVATDTARAAARLRALADGSSDTVIRRSAPRHRVRVAFLFSGQGSQYAGMGAELYRAEPVFRAALDRCAKGLAPHLDRPLTEVLHPADGDGGALGRTAWTQPALFAVEFALAELWRSWGVTPSAVLGHSVGEYTAACVAGVLSLEDALELVVARGRLMESVAEAGAMVSVPLPETAAREAIGDRADRVAVAAVNGDEATVLSGAVEQLDRIVEELAARGVTARRLDVSHAFHSPLLDPVLPELDRIAARFTHAAPRVPLVSNLTGEIADDALLARPDYWSRHARGTVRFHQGVRALGAAGITAFVEVGPGRGLLGLGSRALPDAELLWVPSLRRGRPEAPEIRRGLGDLYAQGAPVRWDRLAPTRGVPHAGLPTYPFQHAEFGFPAVAGAGPAPRTEPAAEPHHPAGSPRYRVAWHEAPLAAQPAAAPGRTLLLADAGGTAERLARRLAARGEECHLAYATAPGAAGVNGVTGAGGSGGAGGAGRSAEAPRVHRIPPAAPAALSALLARTGPLDRVVHLWSLDAPDAARATAADIAAEQVRGVETVTQLLRALAGSAGAPRLWLVTRGAQASGPDDPVDGVAAAPLLGLGKVIALEHAEAWGGAIDLGGTAGEAERELAALDAELARAADPEGEDDVVALRGATRRVPRLVPDPGAGEAEPAPPVRPDASYLITGGLGGLGLTIADWLADHGARHLVLTGRGGLPEPPDGAAEALPEAARDRLLAVRALRERGVTVTVAAADVSDPEAMASLVARVTAGEVPLRGVVHAAGLAGAELLAELPAETLHEVLRPKVTGAWLLHSLLGDTPLDFFLGMSSIASVWGSAHLGAYAAANQFLDALAAHRRARGQAGLSVNWGPWLVASGLGGDELLGRLEANGLRALPAETGLRHLGKLLASPDVVQAVVSGVDWPTLKPLLETRRRRPLLAGISDRAPAVEGAAEPTPELDALLATAAGDRTAAVDGYVRGRLAGQLGVPREEITDEISLLEMGLDSLGVMQLVRRFRRELRLSLQARPFFEEPAIHWARMLADEITTQHAATGPAPVDTDENRDQQEEGDSQ